MKNDKEQAQRNKESKELLLSALDERLSLSIEQRIDAHENARALIQDLIQTQKGRDAGSSSSS